MSEAKTFHDEFTQIVEVMSQVGADIDWRRIREEIIELHNLASEDHEFEATMELYFTLMKAVKEQGGITDLDKFKELNRQEYATFLISENIRGRSDGNINLEKMKKITEREIIAGRMNPDDELYKIVLNFENEMKQKSEKKSFFSRLFGS